MLLTESCKTNLMHMCDLHIQSWDSEHKVRMYNSGEQIASHPEHVPWLTGKNRIILFGLNAHSAVYS